MKRTPKIRVGSRVDLRWPIEPNLYKANNPYTVVDVSGKDRFLIVSESIPQAKGWVFAQDIELVEEPINQPI
jgi:hypothetical protein